jgi:hypothetical protein
MVRSAAAMLTYIGFFIDNTILTSVLASLVAFNVIGRIFEVPDVLTLPLVIGGVDVLRVTLESCTSNLSENV